MRHRLGAVLMGAVAALALVACSTSTEDPYASSGDSGDRDTTTSGTSVTIGLTYIPNVQFAPVYVAKDDGIYRSAGLNATVRHHGTDEGLFTALAAGEEDVVVASGDEVLPARDQGIDLVSIGSFYQSYPVTIIVPEDSSIQSLADLKGAKVGVPGEYGSSWYGLLAGLQQAGLTSSDITVVSIGYTQQAALAAGQVDAVVGFTNNELIAFQQAGVAVRTIDLDPTTTPLVSASIITTRTWLDDHPDLAKAVVEATTTGIQRVVDNPQHALEVTRNYDETLNDSSSLATARAVLAATITLFTGADGQVRTTQDLDRWQQMGAFQASIPGVLSSTPDVAAAVTNDVSGG